MYNNMVRRCGNIAGKLCYNLIIRPSRQKTHVARFTKTHCVPSYLVISRDYTTDNSNMRVLPIIDDDCQKDSYCDTENLDEKDSQENVETIKFEDLPETDQIAQTELNELCKIPENKKQIEVLKLEVELARYDLERVPDYLRPRHWLALFNLKTRMQRRRYLEYLWRNEKKSQNRQSKKEYKLLQKEVEEGVQTSHIEYGLGKNSLFQRVYNSTMNQFYHARLMQAILFEPKIVFDLGYCNYMTPMENTNCARQLVLSFVANRQHQSPFNLYFCNADKSSLLMQQVTRIMPIVYDIDFPLNVTSQSYLDLFDKSKLIYLTPHCNNELHEYDPDMIYIIGAMVDKSNPQPLSLAKAKREGVKMAKLPLARFLKWKAGAGKNLTLNQVLRILLDVRETKSWQTALNHVPTRKLTQD